MNICGLTGKLYKIDSDNIILKNQTLAFEIKLMFIPHGQQFTKPNFYYLVNCFGGQQQNEAITYCFLSWNDRQRFIKLLKISGIGPITAQTIFQNWLHEGIKGIEYWFATSKLKKIINQEKVINIFANNSV